MNIYIPTIGRIDKQITWDQLTPVLREKTVLVCPANEALEHQALGRNVLICPENGIGRTRQWIVDQAQEQHLAMVDDDLIFLKRKDPWAWNLRRILDEDVEEMFTWVETMLESYPQVGVSARQGNNRHFPVDLVTCTRVMNFHAYDVHVLRRIGARFIDPSVPSNTVMEDFHLTLTLLESGYENALITDYAWDQTASNAKGGCSTYRTAEVQKASAHLLAQRHPGLVRVVEKETKGGWAGIASSEGGGTRTDVVISWKKAYQMGIIRRAA